MDATVLAKIILLLQSAAFTLSVAEDGVQLLVVDILVDGFNSSKGVWKEVEKNINEMTEKAAPLLHRDDHGVDITWSALPWDPKDARTPTGIDASKLNRSISTFLKDEQEEYGKLNVTWYPPDAVIVVTKSNLMPVAQGPVFPSISLVAQDCGFPASAVTWDGRRNLTAAIANLLLSTLGGAKQTPGCNRTREDMYPVCALKEMEDYISRCHIIHE